MSYQNHIHKRKKGFKHSRKFARSQKGCLQCRQKKKKCDMNRPGCDSCSKRGIDCEYPENIKIFQIESFQTYEPLKQDGTKDLTRTPKMKMHEIKFEKEESGEKKGTEPKNVIQSKTSQPIAKTSSITHIEHTTPSSPLSQHNSLTTQFTINHQSQEYHSPPRPQQEAQPQQIQQLLSVLKTNTNNTDDAILLATEGRSIKSILDGFAIDLIKRSIETLQFINLEKQKRQYEQAQRYELEQQEKMKEWAIKEALKFGGSDTQSGSLLFAADTHTETTAHVNALQEAPRIDLGHDALVDWESEIFKVGWQG